MSENSSTSSSIAGKHVLLGVTGSVAAVKAPEIAVRLVTDHQAGMVKVLLTRGGKNFWDKAALYNPPFWEQLQQQEDCGRVEIHLVEDEWRRWNVLGDLVMHIELRDWADCLIIAPLSAHTLAKLAHGFCDDALSSVMRAWDLGHVDGRPAKPVLLAPAMNTAMWQHPLTQQQLTTVQSFWKTNAESAFCGIWVVHPQVKTLACGEVGDGALADVNVILSHLQKLLTAVNAAPSVGSGKALDHV